MFDKYKCRRTWLDGKISRLTEKTSSTLIFGSKPEGLQRALRAVKKYFKWTNWMIWQKVLFTRGPFTLDLLFVNRHRRKLAPFELAEVKMQMLVDLRSAVVEYELIARYDLNYTNFSGYEMKRHVDWINVLMIWFLRRIRHGRFCLFCETFYGFGYSNSVSTIECFAFILIKDCDYNIKCYDCMYVAS